MSGNKGPVVPPGGGDRGWGMKADEQSLDAQERALSKLSVLQRPLGQCTMPLWYPSKPDHGSLLNMLVRAFCLCEAVGSLVWEGRNELPWEIGQEGGVDEQADLFLYSTSVLSCLSEQVPKAHCN